MGLPTLIHRQNNKCYYCQCEMTRIEGSRQQATIEHLVDKWSSPKHNKIENPENLVAACFHCNNSRANIRNRIARNYYKQVAGARSVKINVTATPSKILYKMFGPVPQQIFNV